MYSVCNFSVLNFNPAILSQKFSERFLPYYALNAHLEKITQKISVSASYTLNDTERAHVQEALIKCGRVFAGKLLKNLTQLPKDIIKDAIFKSLEHDELGTIKSSLETFISSINEDDFLRFSDTNKEMVKNAFEKNILLKSHALDDSLYTKGKTISKELSYEISYFCHHLIQTFIAGLGFNEIREGPTHRWEGSSMSSLNAKSKIEIYFALLAYPSIVFVALYSLVSCAVLAGMVTGAIVLASLLFIPIYIRYLRPCPRLYEGLNNLNQAILRKDAPPPFLRVDILDRIQNAFCAGKGVILTGDPGSGKTSVANSLASLIVAKEAKEGAEFLNAAQMFSANANQFKGLNSFDSLSFESIEGFFKDHKKNFVLFIDEVTSLYEKSSLSGNTVKTFLTFLDKFPNVICATTTKEYEQYIKNDDPVMRRLVHIELEPLKRKELESALFQYLHYTAPELVLEEGSISLVIEKAAEFNPKTSQIDGAMSLLKGAIIKATHISFEKLEKEIDNVRLEIECLENHLLHSDQTDSKELDLYRQKQITLKTAQEQLSAKRKALDQIKKIEAISLKLKNQAYKLAAKSTTQDAMKSRKWMINHVMLQFFTDFLMTKRNELELPKGITKDLIHQMVDVPK